MATESLSNSFIASIRLRLSAMLTPGPSPELEESPRKKPANLLYDVDDAPPLLVRLGVSVQHVFLMSIGWLYVLVIVNSFGGTRTDAESIIRMSMIAGGLATILQANRRIVGSGYFCPLSGSLTYLQPSILAARSGGFSVLFGMVAAAGVFTSFLSRVASRLRVLFPPEVTGLMVTMSGLQLIALAVPRFAGYTTPGAAPEARNVAVGAVTLFAMVAATVWNRGNLHVLPILCGLVFGFTLAITLGVFPWHDFVHQFNEPWISLPRRLPLGIGFRWALLVPFMIAALTASLKTVGDLTLCQKINDEDWKRTDMHSVSGGLFANGLGTSVSGLLGGVAQNTVSSSVGLSLATGTTSRLIAIPTGIIVIVLAFFPKLTAVFASMPLPVMGAMLIYSACFIVLGGVQLLTSRMLDSRRIFAVGVSLIFGLSVEISPDVYRFAPDALKPIFSSSTSLATILLVTLSLLFRLGVSKQRTFVFHPGTEALDSIHKIMEEQGGVWGMRREVEVRAEHAIHEVLATVVRLNPFLRSVDVTLEFNELRLNVAVEYNGAGPVLSDTLPSPEQMATEEGISAMSGFMIRSYADRVRVKSKGNSWCRIQLSFDH
ncbi:MAG TPA: solute carrier family 23 protein [Candidatus Sulfotelmatobacter sp.]|nr:solute carrier family 23 protein [Candidatus Sulfotelmatobacter sp.]